MSAITIDNNLVHYEVLGRGRPVILIHGWLGSWRYWIPTMQQLSMKYRVYALDLWGFGDTEKEQRHYSFAAQVRLLTDFMDKLGISKAAVIGHGLGAAVSITFTRQFPERAPRVVLVSPPLFDMGGLSATPPPIAVAHAGLPPLPTPATPPVTAPVSTTTSPITPATAPTSPAPPALPVTTSATTPAMTPASVTAPVADPLSAPPKPASADPNASDTLKRNPFMANPEKMAELQQTIPSVSAGRTTIQAPGPSVDPLSKSFSAPSNPLMNLLTTVNPKAALEKQLMRDPASLDKMRGEVDKMDGSVLARMAGSFQGINLAQQLSQLTSPVLLFHGKDDTFIEPQEKLIETIGALKANGLFIALVEPDFRHFPMLEQTAKFNRLLIDFLDAPDLTNKSMKETWRRQLR